jgi:radical SAM superfamily enzyme YgiQ (UPF0313 family)
MEYLIINPISFIFNPAPILGLPTLLGVLENNNINYEFKDFNLMYLNKMFSRKSIMEYIFYYDELKKNSELYNIFNKYDENRAKLLFNINKIEFCKTALKHKELFYDYVLQYYSTNTINIVSELFSNFSDEIREEICADLNSYRNFSDDTNFNIDINLLNSYFNSDILNYKKFYEENINNLVTADTKIVGISINHHKQLVPGLYLCYLLMQKTNVHINIGGSFFQGFHKQISNLDDILTNYADSISIDYNSQTALELIKYVKNEINIEEVPSLIYKKGNDVLINNNIKDIPFEDMPYQSFKGFDKSLYLVPEIVLPICLSKSCYWHKCIFCSCYDSQYQQISVEKLIDEIEYLSKKYNTKYFYFWDNAISPKNMEKIADILIAKNLNIKYSIFARLEKEFSFSLLKKMKKSGCLMIYFGLDSASDRVLKYINKGITSQQAHQVLKASHNAGIFNAVYLILGHPTETIKDLKEDKKFLNKNKKYINSVIVSPDVLFLNGSLLVKNQKEYRKLIVTSREYRLKLYSEIMLKYKFVNSHSVYNLIYLGKIGLSKFMQNSFIAKYILNSKLLLTLFLKYKNNILKKKIVKKNGN